MAFTCRDVTLRLRAELDDPALLVRFDPIRERYVVCQKTRRLAGARRHAVRILDDGAVLRDGGSVILREVVDDYEPIYWHETNAGQFLPLEPNVMRREVLARDNWRGRDVATTVLAQVNEAKARRQRQFEDDTMQAAKDTRRAFARAADEMGW